MYKQITIKTLKSQGNKNTDIAKQLGCHRNTVGNCLAREGVIEKQTRIKESIYAAFDTKIKEYLNKDKKDKVSNFRIYEILRDEYGVVSTYVNLCKYIQKYHPKPKETFGVQITTLGEVAEIDFGYVGMFPGPLGKLVKTYGIAVILPYSRLDFYAITYDQKLETLVKEFENAFVYFGGVPKRLKVDNMKTAILKNQHYDLDFNPDFLGFSYHYNTVIIPCTPYSQEQKGTVEGGVKYAQQNFVPGRTFRNIGDLRNQLKTWNEMINQKVHGTTREVINDRFEQFEKTRLQPLPADAFSFFNRCERIVGSNCHIHFSNNYYSAPFSYVGREVTVRWNQSVIRIICQGEEIALHKLCTDGIGKYVTERVHLPARKLYSEAEYRQYHADKMAQIGRHASQYFLMLLEKQPGYYRQTLRPIYGFVQKYGNEAVDKALGRALSYKAMDARIIRHILEGKLYEIVETLELPVFADTSNSRELTYYES